MWSLSSCGAIGEGGADLVAQADCVHDRADRVVDRHRLAGLEVAVPRGERSPKLAARLGVTSSYISKLEANEASAAITLETLQRAAAALGCRLEYTLVPERPLDEMVMDRARRKARSLLDPVSHSMALEDQAVEMDDQIEALARDLVDRWGSWS